MRFPSSTSSGLGRALSDAANALWKDIAFVVAVVVVVKVVVVVVLVVVIVVVVAVVLVVGVARGCCLGLR